MKILIFFSSLIAALSLLISCQSFNKSSLRNPAGGKPRHLIVSIHGIAGKENTFGSLLPALKEHLEEIDSGYEVLTANFVYATGSEEATVVIFKNEFSKFMRDLYAEHQLNDRDQISIVAHSQGGLITTFWFSDAIDSTGHPDYAVAMRVKNIVTESTPFWGAKAAYLAYDKIKIPAVRNIIQKFVRMSPGELKEMSFGSESIYKFFQSRSELIGSGFEDARQVRMINLAGVFPSWNNPFMQKLLEEHAPNLSQKNYELIKKELFTIFNSGTRWESDSVVNTSSTRIGFMYSIDLGDYKKNKLTPASSFQTSYFLGQDVPLHLIETVHASPEANRLMDIAYVPERCLEKDQCDHPSYKTIFKHLANCDRVNSTCDKEKYQTFLDALFHGDTSYGQNEHMLLMNEMQTFTIAINLRLPINYPIKKSMLNNDDVDEYIKPGYAGYQNRIRSFFDDGKDGLLEPIVKDQIYSVHLGRRGEAYSRVIKHFPDTGHLRFQFTGKVAAVESPLYTADNYKKMQAKGFPVRILIKFPGLKDRWVEVPVRPTYMSFVDIEMKP